MKAIARQIVMLAVERFKESARFRSATGDGRRRTTSADRCSLHVGFGRVRSACVGDFAVIICLGTTPTLARSMSFDSLKVDDVNRAVLWRINAAGKNVNWRRVLTTLGVPAAAVGFLGGPRAAAMRADLDPLTSRTRFSMSMLATRLCVTVIDRAAHHRDGVDRRTVRP